MRIRELFLIKKRKSVDNTESYGFIKSMIDGYAKKIDAPESLLPTYGYSEDFDRSYIEIDSRKMIHFKVKKRGRRTKKESSTDLKHIVYSVFEIVTETMSKDFEQKNRIDNQDPRMIEFEKQEELLGEINSDYADWCKDEHKKILKKAPFKKRLDG